MLSETDAPDVLETPPLDAAIAAAREALLARQRGDGHWVFELEADATIPAEYVMLEHFLGEIDDALEAKLCAYLRRIQNPDGGWPLFYRGQSDVSATVKAYYALKLAGHGIDAPYMTRARERVFALGGAARCNVFTRIALAIFRQVPWRAVPVMPVEIFLLPRWFFFHLSKVSYWSRTVVAPLLIVMALRARARNPRRVDIRELFVTPPELERGYMRPATGSTLGRVFLAFDGFLRLCEPLIPRGFRARALATGMRFITDRLNGEDGLGAIFPAMVNAVMALDVMQYPPDDPALAGAKEALRKLLIVTDDEAYCQPCVSPVWDTALAMHALLETGSSEVEEPMRRANGWLAQRQVTLLAGDWAETRPNLIPGGWAFQYWNDYYPDVDDTAAVVMAMHRAEPERYQSAIERAKDWVVGMQSKDGGWGAFDADNTHYYLNHIPFADHGALLDPPTEDVTGRCVGMLLQLGDTDSASVRAGLDYLERTQLPDGSWFGRWGTNYVYGTWSVLNALRAAGRTSANSRAVRRAIGYLLAFQQPDGGWGEDGATYWQEHRGLCKASTASQTAWAILGLIAAGGAHLPAVRRGVDFLVERQNANGLWDEPWYTAVGFPRVFYLRYDGYRAFFPLQALARYRRVALLGESLDNLGF